MSSPGVSQCIHLLPLNNQTPRDHSKSRDERKPNLATEKRQGEKAEEARCGSLKLTGEGRPKNKTPEASRCKPKCELDDPGAWITPSLTVGSSGIIKPRGAKRLCLKLSPASVSTSKLKMLFSTKPECAWHQMSVLPHIQHSPQLSPGNVFEGTTAAFD